MSDKLQKTDSAIVPASKIADKITSALKDKCTHPMHNVKYLKYGDEPCGKCYIIDKSQRCRVDCACCIGSTEDKPANTGARWPTQNDQCKCGHEYSQHNYSDSLGSRKDPLGFMYECRGAGFRSMEGSGIVPAGQRPICACEQFLFADAPVRIELRQQAKVARFGEMAERFGAYLAKPDRFDYTDMESIIVDEWANRFGYPETLEAVDEIDTKVIQPAMARAKQTGVKPAADIEVSECGCIWALQTIWAYGSGDLLLRNCDKHDLDGILKGF